MMSSPGSPSLSRNRQKAARPNVTACIRCRQKKKRCDQNLPRCGLCATAGVECVGYDAVARREVPRSYTLSLEERIAYLELKLQSNGIQYEELDETGLMPATPNTNTSTAGQGLDNLPLGSSTGAMVRETLEQVQRPVLVQATDEPAFSQVLLKELMSSRQNQGFTRLGYLDSRSVGSPLPSNIVTDLDTSPVSLPTEEATQILVRTFFQFSNQGLPLLHEPTFRHKLELLQSMTMPSQLDEAHTSHETRIALFFVFEILAIALIIMQKQDPSKIPTSLADRYHNAALKALSKVGLPTDIEGVQILLLVGIYSYHHPTIWAAWKTVGAALRLAVELGLHQDPMEQLDALTVDIRRRTFWVAYSMDRSISIALTIPLCLSDGDITAEFPSLVDDANITADGIREPEQGAFQAKTISLHLFRFRQIQSEIRTILFEKPHPAYPQIDMSQWQKRMHDKIQLWFDETPRYGNPTPYQVRDLELFELSFHRAVFYLYHPSPNLPTPPKSTHATLANAAIRVIELYRRFFLEHRITLYWQAVENISSAGIALMFIYVQSPIVRGRVSVHSLQTLIRSCSSILWGVVEHFPAFNGKRDGFDVIASKVLATLNTSSTTPDKGRDGLPPDNPASMTTEIIPDASLPWQAQPQGDTSFLDEHHFASTMLNSSRNFPLVPDMGNGQPPMHDLFDASSFPISQLNDQSPFDWEALQDPTDALRSAWI